ncbi:MAG: SH3 domain-containing protein [Saprospiraceae bacterium]|nr:SH3 domain-containing protein [Saprospiraceae bacterium]
MKLRLFFGFCLLCLSTLVSAKNYVIIGATDVRVRSAANLSSETLGRVQLGEVGEILEKTERSELIQSVTPNDDCNEFYWYKIKFMDRTGWVFGAFVYELRNPSSFYNPDSGEEGLLYNPYQDAAGGDMCLGTNFLVIFNDKSEVGSKAKLIKLKGSYEVESYRGMPSIGFDMEIQMLFVNPKDKCIVLGLGGFAPGDYAEHAVLELYYDKESDSYTAYEKYFSSTY